MLIAVCLIVAILLLVGTLQALGKTQKQLAALRGEFTRFSDAQTLLNQANLKTIENLLALNNALATTQVDGFCLLSERHEELAADTFRKGEVL